MPEAHFLRELSMNMNVYKAFTYNLSTLGITDAEICWHTVMPRKPSERGGDSLKPDEWVSVSNADDKGSESSNRRTTDGGESKHFCSK